MGSTKTKKESAKKSKKITKKNIEKQVISEKIILHPISTEKSIRLMESNNTLAFMVSMRTNKKEIKKAIEELFGAKVVKVTTLITPQGKKKAFIKFSEETPAIDISTKLGLI